MGNKLIKNSIFLLLVIGITLIIFGIVYAGSGSNIDPVHKFAWSANAGWVNFNAAHGGAKVFPDHLEGYAWAENVGWIRLGTHTGGGAHTYANTSKTNYGVNQDGTGKLSGFAWSTNAGWVNFNPTHSGVTIDPVSGDFDGYAWAENVGWIHFSKPGLYNVKALFEKLGEISLPLVIKSK